MNYPVLLHDYFDNSVSNHPHKEALIYGDKRYTYKEVYNQANMVADCMIDLGLNARDRVVIYMDNVPEVIISMYATLKAGGVFAIINSATRARKLSYIIQDCEPKIIIADMAKEETVGQALKQSEVSPVVIWVGKEIKSSLTNDSISRIHWNAIINPDSFEQKRYDFSTRRVLDVDLAALIYTSGSTGDPKGVMEPHFNIISAARSISEYLRNTPDDIILNTLPLSFDYGLYQVIMTFMFGGTLVLEKTFIFLSRILTLIDKEKVTGFPIVPTIVAMIFKTIDIKSFEFKSLRYITNTGSAFPVEHIRKLREILPGVQIFSMFGLTECKRISYLPPEYIDSKPSSVGKAMPNSEVFVVDENEKPVNKGETGQLVVRGSNVMKGYWKAPELTARTFRKGLGYNENLLFTGDFFKMDDEGFLYFLGRKDDMIKSRGERISAKEIENTIAQIEGVMECAVIGVADEILGQAIKAYVALFPSVTMDKKDITSYCVQNLESYSVPKYVEIISELPKTPHGKIDKKALKEENTQIDPDPVV